MFSSDIFFVLLISILCFLFIQPLSIINNIKIVEIVCDVDVKSLEITLIIAEVMKLTIKFETFIVYLN